MRFDSGAQREQEELISECNMCQCVLRVAKIQGSGKASGGVARQRSNAPGSKREKKIDNTSKAGIRAR
jgi:hypothetical protein